MTSLETIPTLPRPAPDSSPARSAAAPPSGPTFARLLEDWAERVDGGDALVENASAGGYAGMDAGRLIALQAGIYRYSEAIELGAKLVDRAASSVRAVLQAGH